MKKILKAIFATVFSLSTAGAAVLLTDRGQGLAGSFEGEPITSGFTFTVGSSDLLLYSLGVCDLRGEGLVNSHLVGLWDSSGNLLASATVDSGTTIPLENGFRFVDLVDPVSLTSGSIYYLGALYPLGDTDRYVFNYGGNQATASADVTLGNSVYTRPGSGGSDENGWGFPKMVDAYGGSSVGPNAKYTIVPVPESSATSFAILAGLLILGRRRA